MLPAKWCLKSNKNLPRVVGDTGPTEASEPRSGQESLLDARNGFYTLGIQFGTHFGTILAVILEFWVHFLTDFHPLVHLGPDFGPLEIHFGSIWELFCICGTLSRKWNFVARPGGVRGALEFSRPLSRPPGLAILGQP